MTQYVINASGQRWMCINRDKKRNVPKKTKTFQLNGQQCSLSKRRGRGNKKNQTVVIQCISFKETDKFKVPTGYSVRKICMHEDSAKNNNNNTINRSR